MACWPVPWRPGPRGWPCLGSCGCPRGPSRASRRPACCSSTRSESSTASNIQVRPMSSGWDALPSQQVVESGLPAGPVRSSAVPGMRRRIGAGGKSGWPLIERDAAPGHTKPLASTSPCSVQSHLSFAGLIRRGHETVVDIDIPLI